MIKRLVTSFFVALLTLLSVPSAQAVDIPTLTWERGKEQNVVVGSISSQGLWQAKLLRPGSPQISLSPSSINSRGYSVFSATLPPNLPLGEYTVYIFDRGNSSGTKVAQVTVVELRRYSITNIPHDLLLILLTLVFFLTALSVAAGAGYLKFSHLRQKTLVESQELLFAKSVPRVIYPVYLLRAGSLVKFRRSTFKYFLAKDETLVHKISPLLWSVLPLLAFALGLQGGLVSKSALDSVPIYSLIALSIVGLVDSFSGIFGLLGFCIGQIVVGQVLDLRSAFVVASFGLSWVLVGFLTEIVVSAINQELSQNAQTSPNWLVWLPAIIVAALFSASMYYSTLLVIQSLSMAAAVTGHKLLLLSTIVGLCAAIKVLLHRYLDWRISQQDSPGGLEVHEFEVDSLLRSSGTFFLGLATFFTCFIWTTNWSLSLLIGAILVITCKAFTLKITLPKLPFLRKWKRNLLLESAIVTYVVYLLFLLTRRLPFDTSLKSEIFLTFTLSLPALHFLLSALRPESSAQVESN